MLYVTDIRPTPQAASCDTSTREKSSSIDIVQTGHAGCAYGVRIGMCQLPPRTASSDTLTRAYCSGRRRNFTRLCIFKIADLKVNSQRLNYAKRDQARK